LPSFYCHSCLFYVFIDVGKPCLGSDLGLKIINFSQKSTEYPIGSLKLMTAIFGAVTLVRQLGLYSFLEVEFTMKFNIFI
jgi:hypothetical protein